MRKINPKRKAWLDKHAKCIALKKKIVQKRVKNKADRSSSAAPRETNSFIVAPKMWGIPWRINYVEEEKTANAFFEFIKKIRAVSHKHVKIDFTEVEHIYSNAALIFKAEIDYLAHSKQKAFVTKPSESDKIRQVFTQTGMDKLLNNPQLGSSSINHEDVIHWVYAQGTIANMSDLLVFAETAFLTKYPNLSAILSTLLTGISEAIFNCAEHAYKHHQDLRPCAEKQTQWWVFSQIKDERLYVSVLDIGIGFKNTIALNFPEIFQHLITRVLPRRHKRTIDDLCIQAATELDRSGTGVRGRGKGMRCAHKVVNECKDGVFHIHSRRGSYRYIKNHLHPHGNATYAHYDSDLPATIYTWQLSLRS